MTFSQNYDVKSISCDIQEYDFYALNIEEVEEAYWFDLVRRSICTADTTVNGEYYSQVIQSIRN